MHPLHACIPWVAWRVQHPGCVACICNHAGFATVFRAYDLQRHEFVACKLHSIGKDWTESRKSDFVRHVEREIDITVEIRHRRIVGMDVHTTTQALQISHLCAFFESLSCLFSHRRVII